ncbi:hypothetical protein K0M31_002572 [Melipona bicolor]|uniref:Uncharacterized protein n=1 Tax=Melipona bicolor TaxID=60889 RepID=A0AA40GIT2_9HYME|nr:hypothetical protein K0M31_002572 [Melipona bicolor]
MYEDTEDASDVDEEFYNALALLHSTENDSAEKLRKMLHTSIEKKYGFDKSLIARMPKKFPQNAKICGKSETSWRKKGSDKLFRYNCSSPLFSANNTTESNWKPTKISDADVEDCSEKTDIPRISIPDEGFGDGLLCKVSSSFIFFVYQFRSKRASCVIKSMRFTFVSLIIDKLLCKNNFCIFT